MRAAIARAHQHHRDGMVRSCSTFNVALKLLESCDPDRKPFGTFNENPAVVAAAMKSNPIALILSPGICVLRA
jgi:hypothetical protein